MQANEKHIFYCSCQFPFARSTVISLISYADVSRLPFLPRKMLFNVFFSFDIPHVGKFLSGAFYIFHSLEDSFAVFLVNVSAVGRKLKEKIFAEIIKRNVKMRENQFSLSTAFWRCRKSVNLTNTH